MHTAKPTKAILNWYEQEMGVLIHYIWDTYDAAGLKIEEVDPPKLDPEQWVKAVYEMGGKYAIITANHGSGFSAWPTKENDFSPASFKWKDGKGDVVKEFVEACRKYGIKPGLYYHTKRNDYYNIDNSKTYDYKGEWYQNYVRIVERQIKELCTEYGEIFEFWFDGAIFKPEEGGPDLEPILTKYQPNAVCFQGPINFANNVRWVGNERGLAPENCWPTTNMGDDGYDGTIEHLEAGVGDPDGKYFWPAETDMPNRTPKAYCCGWNWKENEGHLVFTPDELLDCYVRSVGRNSNFTIGMTVTPDGEFEDVEQFRAFGKKLREVFGTPVAMRQVPTAENNEITLNIPEGSTFDYLVVREEIADGLKIRAYDVLIDGEKVYSSNCIGHKRIIPLKGTKAKTLTFKVTEQAGDWKLRDIAVY